MGGGAAGVLIIGFIVSIINFFISWVNYGSVRRNIKTNAVICSLADTSSDISDNGKVSHTEYKYVVKICHNEKTHYKKMVEVVDGEKNSKFSVNQTIDVFFDEEDYEVVEVKTARRKVTMWLFGAGFCLVGLCVIFVLSAVFSNFF